MASEPEVVSSPVAVARPGRHQVEAPGHLAVPSAGVVVAGANVHDVKLLEATIDSVVGERPDPDEVEQHLLPR